MVTRLYTPMLPSYARPKVAGAESRAGAPSGWPQPQGEPSADAFDANRSSRGLATLADQEKTRKIQLDSILRDFKSTMGALGADESVQAKVETYLSVIRLQGQEAEPNVPLIRQTLATAAKSLDGFITQALGQPSSVVQEWVKALLAQEIDYRAVEADPPSDKPKVPEDARTSADKTSEIENEAEPSVSEDPSALSVEEKLKLKACIEESRAHQAQQRWSEAETRLREGLDLLTDKNRPDLEGKLFNMLGRQCEQARKPEEALDWYRQAAEKFDQSGQPQKRAHVLYTMATLEDELGNLPDAETLYGQSADLDRTLGNTRGLGRTLNDLGSLHLRRGQAAKAEETLKEALRENTRPEGDPGLVPDILSNLASAYRARKQYPKAAKAYQASMQHALRNKDQDAYLATMRNLASLYLEGGKSEKAMPLLRRAEALDARRRSA